MKKLYLLFLSLFCLGATALFAQISVTASQGTAGPTAYTTLKAAFDAINAGTHKQVVTISINGNTTETATAKLNGPFGTADYVAVFINATGAFSISGNLTTPIISLDNASRVTLNGNNTLQIVNTNATGSTISFINDATGNIIRNTIIKGNTASFTGTAAAPTINSGVVSFLTTTTLNGNSANSLDNCEIDGGNNAICLIYSSGSTASATVGDNVVDTIRNCRLHDFVNPTIAGAIAINLAANNSDWTIQGNSIYQTTAVNTPMQHVVTGLLAVPNFTSDQHFISGNFFGGNAPLAAGTMSLTGSAANALGFTGFSVQTGGAGNLVQNNTVRNINLSYAAAAGSFGNAGIFAFIGGYDGTTTITGNTVSNITVANTVGFISFQGIHANGRVTSAGTTVRPLFTITNNNVTNIAGNAGGAAGDVSITCLRLETSSGANLGSGADKANPTFNVSGNNINTVTNSFNGVASSVLRGIGTVATQGAGSAALLHPKLAILNNTIHTITTASGVGTLVAGNAYAVPVISGIHFGGFGGATPNVTDTIRISGNSIYNLSGTRGTDSGYVVTGIFANSGILEIFRNKVYDLKSAATGPNYSPAAGIVGINVRRTDGTASSRVANNFVSIGSTLTNNLQLFGILNNFAAATGPLNVDYNTVVVTGTAAAGNNKATAAYHRGTEALGANVTTPTTLRNNIFYNSRTGGGNHFAIANTHTTPATGFASAYNNLYSANAATVAFWNTTALNLASYAASAGDATSKSVTVSFANVAAGDLHLSGASISDVNLKGLPIAGITTDIDGDARSATTPTMGADEGTSGCVAPTITTQPVAAAACAGGSATFTVVAAGTTLTYQWRKGGVNIAGATNASYSLSPIAAADAANYDVVISNGCGSVTSSVVALSLYPNPTASFTVSTPACANSSLTFTNTSTIASGNVATTLWNFGNGNTSVLANPTQAYAAPGTYNVKLVATSNNGCRDSVTTAVTVNAVTAITTQPANQSACAGAAVNFTVAATGAALTYQWRKGGVNIAGATSATYAIAAAAAGDAGNYDVVVSGTCGSVTSAAASLTLNAAPVITTQPTAQSGCAGGSATFTVAASGSGLTYQWRKGGVNIAGATSASFTLSNLSATDAANYDVVVSTSCATSVISSAVALTLNVTTAITAQPTPQTVCTGANATFSVTATGAGLTYQWRRAGTNIAGATGASYTVTGATAANAGTYDVVVTGTCGAVTSTGVALTVNATTAITTQPTAVAVCAGAAANFTVVATGTGLTYQWRKGGTAIAGATSATYNIATTVVADAGNYDVVVTGTCGTVTSTAVALTVNTGGGCVTALPVIDADVTAAALLPNFISSQTVLRLDVRRSMRTDWTVADANGRVVMNFSRQVTAGRNDIRLSLAPLAAGTYTLTGANNKGRVAHLRFVKH